MCFVASALPQLCCSWCPPRPAPRRVSMFPTPQRELIFQHCGDPRLAAHASSLTQQCFALPLLLPPPSQVHHFFIFACGSQAVSSNPVSLTRDDARWLSSGIVHGKSSTSSCPCVLLRCSMLINVTIVHSPPIIPRSACKRSRLRCRGAALEPRAS